MRRAINLAENEGFNVKLILLPKDYKDPDECVQKNPEAFDEAIKKALSVYDFYLESASRRFDLSTGLGKKEASNWLLPLIAEIPNKIEQAHWVQKLSQKLDVAESAIMEELRSVIPAKAGIHGVDSGSRSGMTLRSREDLIKQKIIALVAKDPESMSLIDQEIKVWLGDFSATPEDAIKAEAEFAEDGAEELQICLAELRELNRRAELSKISNFIKLEQDQQKKEDLIKEFNKKAKDLHAKEKK